MVLTDETILISALFLFLYAFFFALGLKIWAAFFLMAGFMALFFAFFLWTVTANVAVAAGMATLGAMTLILGLFTGDW